MRNLVLFVVILLSACAYHPVRNQAFDQIKLGMSKEETVKLLGRPYSQISTRKVGDATVEILEYRKGNFWWWGDLEDSYWFHYDNDKLAKWGSDIQLRYLD
jgi:hypothetical protein